jgi:hypothetical protein
MYTVARDLRCEVNGKLSGTGRLSLQIIQVMDKSLG